MWSKFCCFNRPKNLAVGWVCPACWFVLACQLTSGPAAGRQPSCAGGWPPPPQVGLQVGRSHPVTWGVLIDTVGVFTFSSQINRDFLTLSMIGHYFWWSMVSFTKSLLILFLRDRKIFKIAGHSYYKKCRCYSILKLLFSKKVTLKRSITFSTK